MKNRSIAAVVLLPFVTLGIYTIYWFVTTKGELNTKGANIPTAWLIIIPFVNIWWMWKYFEAAEQVTNKKVNGILMFVLAVFITSIISSALCQNEYNNLTETSAPLDPVTPVEPVEIASSTEPLAPVSTAETVSPVAETPNTMSQDVSAVSQPSEQPAESGSDDNTAQTQS